MVYLVQTFSFVIADFLLKATSLWAELSVLVVAAQLVNHIERHGMMEAHQSAYHSSHSTEIAVLKVKTDVI